jgi:hypothetical protein
MEKKDKLMRWGHKKWSDLLIIKYQTVSNTAERGSWPFHDKALLWDVISVLWQLYRAVFLLPQV